ncbi:MAG: TIGR03936 family radical SAM-associated protein [Candidatus Brocadiales bacterium]
MANFFKFQERDFVGRGQPIRIRLRFQKTGVLRFISHHDLMRLFERAIRRANIPILMSQGFNPRPKMSFPAALALGIEGADEIFELELSQWVASGKLQERLNAQLPPGLSIVSAEPVAPRSPSSVSELVYRIEGALPKELTLEKVNEFLTAKKFQVTREKKGGKKLFNLRSSIVSITVEESTLLLKLKPTKEGMARPDEVLKALGLSMGTDNTLRITRSAVHLSPSREGK